jgi:phosphoribosylformylglycinamidine cyclo-ligase
MQKKESAYKEAGVDIDKAANLIERIKPHVKGTDRAGVMSSIGGFGAMFDLKKTGLKDPILVSSTDGVGTKIKIAIENNINDTIGIDCVAMCVNDVIVQGAEPLFFLDYFATGKLDNDVAEAVIAGVAEGCKISNCALIGGETAEMPGLYAPGDYDLAGFSVGVVERDRIITGENVAAGDTILGLASSGVHSNGFSLVRKLAEKYDYSAEAPFMKGKSLAQALLTPTRIYVRSILAAIKDEALIKAMAHITGGGFLENIPRVLPDDACAQIDAKAWKLPPVFEWLKDIGKLSYHDLATTLNCGIGMVIVCDAKNADKLTKILQQQGETVYRLGSIKKRGKSEPAVQIDNQDAWA